MMFSEDIWHHPQVQRLTLKGQVKIHMNAKKIVGLAVAAAGVSVPFFGGRASADDSSFRDKSVDNAKNVKAASNKVPTYTIQSGDTLNSISEATGVSVTDLQAYNDLSSSDLIVSGSELKLAGSKTTTTSSAADETTSAAATSDSSTATTATSTTTTASTSSSVQTSADATLAALNAMRKAAGLNELIWDSSLAATATSRAALTAASGVPSDHWSTSGEVISIGFAAGATVVSAWYNETNMTSSTGTGHRDWEMNSSYTHVGFGYVNGVIVGEAY